jgi:hypothetical protein
MRAAPDGAFGKASVACPGFSSLDCSEIIPIVLSYVSTNSGHVVTVT